jgi:cytochrome P450
MKPVPEPIAPIQPSSRIDFRTARGLRWKSPVHPVVLPDKQQAWLVTRYRDVASVLADERFVNSPPNAGPPGLRNAGPWMPTISVSDT